MPQSAAPFGKYWLLKRIAVGGMAELFLASDAVTRELVVIKRILPHLSRQQEFARMFLDEARIAVQLHHPNVIQVNELGKLNDAIFIAMEYVAGCDVRKILVEELKRARVVPYPIAAFILSKVCSGLHYAHERVGRDGKPLEVVHRDISPQNVMVGFDGAIKLVDFGIAKASAIVEQSQPGIIKGKFLYLSPEQLTQEGIDRRADLFAIGTMLYEITTGRSPFLKTATEAVIFAIRTEDPPPPHLVRSDYPFELSRIVMRCLAKDRSRRYQTAGEIEQDLNAFLRAVGPLGIADIRSYLSDLFGRGDDEPTISDEPVVLEPATGSIRGASVVSAASLSTTASDRPLDLPPLERSQPERPGPLTNGRYDLEEEPDTQAASPSEIEELIDGASKSSVVEPTPRRAPTASWYEAAGQSSERDTTTATDGARALDEEITRSERGSSELSPGRQAAPPAPTLGRSRAVAVPANDAVTDLGLRERHRVVVALGVAALVAATSLLWVLFYGPLSTQSVRQAEQGSSGSRAGATIPVRFRAPAGTRITHESGHYAPNIEYHLQPGPKEIVYRCPAAAGQRASERREQVLVKDRTPGTQVITLCEDS